MTISWAGMIAGDRVILEGRELEILSSGQPSIFDRTRKAFLVRVKGESESIAMNAPDDREVELLLGV